MVLLYWLAVSLSQLLPVIVCVTFRIAYHRLVFFVESYYLEKCYAYESQLLLYDVITCTILIVLYQILQYLDRVQVLLGGTTLYLVYQDNHMVEDFE